MNLSVHQLRHSPAGSGAIVAIAALDLVAGRLTVLTGPSGSGKSTLLYLLSGLLVPTQGRILWNGTDIAALGEGPRDRWRRRNAGFIFQDFHLIEELSPLDNVLAPVWFGPISAGGHHARAKELLARFGVPDRRRVALLSRGEQQRVALARALLLQPQVIFADEPTASLDEASGVGVARELLAQAHDGGRCVIVASHDPAVIALADRRLQLERGQLAEFA